MISLLVLPEQLNPPELVFTDQVSNGSKGASNCLRIAGSSLAEDNTPVGTGQTTCGRDFPLALVSPIHQIVADSDYKRSRFSKVGCERREQL